MPDLNAERKTDERPAQRAPVHPLMALRAQLASIEKIVETLDDIDHVRALVASQVAAATALLDSIAFMQRPPQSAPPMDGRRFATFDGPVQVGRRDPPAIDVDEAGDITRPQLEG